MTANTYKVVDQAYIFQTPEAAKRIYLMMMKPGLLTENKYTLFIDFHAIVDSNTERFDDEDPYLLLDIAKGKLAEQKVLYGAPTNQAEMNVHGEHLLNLSVDETW